MNYDELSRQIQRLAGGGGNVASHTNCMTRLRLDLVDPSKADAAAIKALDGVLGVVEGEQMQIIVGPGHAERLRAAYDAVSGDAGSAALHINVDSGDAGPDPAEPTRAKVKARQDGPLQRLFRHVGNIFIPIIPGFIACGLVAAIANVWKMLVPTVTTNPWFGVLAGIGGILGGALQFIVGHNTAKEFGGTPVLGLVAGGLPYMVSLGGIPATGAAPAQPLTIPLFGDLAPGLGGIIGVMVTAWAFAVVEKAVRRVVLNQIGRASCRERV